MAMETQELQLYDIYELRYVPLYEIWYVKLAIIISIFLLSYIVRRIYLWYTTKPKIEVVISPWQKAYTAIEALKKDTQHSAVHNYFVITQEVKEFIENHYTLSHKGMTDSEFLECIKDNPSIPPTILLQLKYIFHDAENIKFGASEIAETKYKQAFQSAELILKETSA